MQTVNFNCPHCGNLMAVGLNLLGRNVRCPHCKQVLRAPAAGGGLPEVPPQAPAAPKAPLPTFNVPKPTEHQESIFSDRREHDDDLFGTAPPKPLIPPPPAPPPVPASLNPTNTAPLPLDKPFPGFETTSLLPQDAPPIPSTPLPKTPLPEPSQSTLPSLVDAPGRFSRPTRAVAESTPAFVWMLMIYSAVVSVAAGVLGFMYFTRGSSGEHPFHNIPDFYGQYEKASRKQTSFNNMPNPKMDVPADLRVKLGGEITIGNLRVQPVSVTRQRPSRTTIYTSGQDKVGEMGGDTLVLTLKVKNVSKDTVFHPNDPAFTRAESAKAPLPYTALQVGPSFFYGTFPWPPDPDIVEQTVIGHEADREPLQPGQERETWVVVAPKGARAARGDVLEAVRGLAAESSLLWRVQLRKGLVQAPDASGTTRDVSATAVIGVEFKAGEIQ